MLLVVGAAVAAGVLGSFTDWLFMGVLFHEAYHRYPEIWRPGVAAGSEKRAILISSVIGAAMSFAIVGLCVLAHIAGITQGLLVALLAWIAGPLGLMLINGLFIKLDGRIIASHAIGYLMRFAIAGISAGLALSMQP
jgi:hypothetical protein